MSPPPAAAPGSISRQARIEHLPDLLGFVDHACQTAGLEEGPAYEVHLAVEEVCSNIIRHGYAGTAPGPIRLGFRKTADRVVVTVSDDAPTFEPAAAPHPDLTPAWQARRDGGLGWHLIFQFVDEVHHEPGRGRGNHLTLIKHLQSAQNRPSAAQP